MTKSYRTISGAPFYLCVPLRRLYLDGASVPRCGYDVQEDFECGGNETDFVCEKDSLTGATPDLVLLCKLAVE